MELVTVGELEAATGVAAYKLRRWIDRGLLGPLVIRAGRNRLVRRSDLAVALAKIEAVRGAVALLAGLNGAARV
jgi:DNA-binding transcriptional MerR regulator